MKKNLLVFTGLLGLVGGLTLASCGSAVKPNVSKAGVSFSTMYTSSAITGINVLNSNTNVKKMANHKEEAKQEALTDEEKAAVIRNYELLEGLLSDDVISTEPVKPEANDKHGEYDFTYEVTVKNLDGTKDSYVFYYNELTEEEFNKNDEEKVNLISEAEDQEEEDKKTEESEQPEEDKETEEAESEETESHLKGIVIMGEKEYEMKGSKEVEVSSDEVETELTYEILDPETAEKIIMKQEAETETEDNKTENEQEFSIKRYNSEGKEIYKKKISVETDELGEVEYSVKENIAGVKSKIKFEILTNPDGKKVVEAKIVENDKTITTEFKVVVNEDNTVSYEFLEDLNEEE